MTHGERIGNPKSNSWVWLLLLAIAFPAYWFYGDVITAYFNYFMKMIFH